MEFYTFKCKSMVTPSVSQRWCDITYGCVTLMYVVYVHTNGGTYALSVSLRGWMPCNAIYDFINYGASYQLIVKNDEHHDSSDYV